MADQNEREAVAQDLDIDEQQSEEVAGGAGVPTELMYAAEPVRIKTQPPVAVPKPPL